MSIDKTRFNSMNPNASKSKVILGLDSLRKQKAKLLKVKDASRGIDTVTARKLQNIEAQMANFEAWGNSSASLLSKPKYAGDRSTKKVAKTRKPNNINSPIREKTERLRRQRLGLDKPIEVVEQSVPKPVELVKEEPIVEQLEVAVEPTLEEHLVRIRKLKEDSDRIKGTQAAIREGFVYLVINPAWSEWVKVGQTLDYVGRLKTYQTASPDTDYEMVYIKYTDDSLAEETQILNAAANAFQVKGEWVRCSIEELKLLMRI